MSREAFATCEEWKRTEKNQARENHDDDDDVNDNVNNDDDDGDDNDDDDDVKDFSYDESESSASVLLHWINYIAVVVVDAFVSNLPSFDVIWSPC